MKTKIYVPDIECDSCTKLISKKLKQEKQVSSFSFDNESVEITHDESLKDSSLIKIIKDSGFRAAKTPFERKNIAERLRDAKENKKKYKTELTGLKYAAGIFLILSFIEALAYFGFLNQIPYFIERYALYLFYLNLSISVISASLWHFFAYRAKVTCMVGMMVGMGFGMQSGMMLGAIIGAANGFFIGALAAMLIGVFLGIITGKCCGAMGIIQGMMAGVMGGTMGPMISVMMIAEGLQVFLPFYMLINAVIAIGISYIIFEESVEGKEVERKPADFVTFASAGLIAAFIIAALMIYGPKSAAIAL